LKNILTDWKIKEKRTLAVQVTEELFQRVKWAVAKEGIKQKDFLIRIIEKAVEEVEAKWKELKQPEETPEADRLEEAEGPAEETSEEEITQEGIEGMEAAEEEPDDENFEESAQLEEEEPDSELPEDADEEEELSESEEETEEIA